MTVSAVLAASAFIGIIGPMAHATLDQTGRILPRVRYTKNGGMRFLRIGRLQMSWCVCKASI